MDWKEEFINCVNSGLLDEAWTIRQHNLPKKIFKYRAVTERSLENLKTDTVWLCSPSKYNEPYDSASTINFDRFLVTRLMDSEDLSAEEIEGIKESLDPIAMHLKLKLQKEILRPNEMSENRYEEVLEEVATMLKKAANRTFEKLVSPLLFLGQFMKKICSFSSTKSSIIMWAHYAQNHEGFCIEYNLASLDKNDDRRASLFPVIYSDKLFDVARFFDLAMEFGSTLDSEVVDPVKSKAIFEKFKMGNFFSFLYKSREWFYEQEWRLVFTDDSLRPDRSYLMPTPSAIYLGARISEKNKKQICDIADSRNIDVYQMKLSGLEFKLYEEKKGITHPKPFEQMHEEFNLLKEKLIAELTPPVQIK